MSYRIEAATKEEWAERALSGEKKLADLKDSIKDTNKPIKVVEIEEHDDGSATLQVECDPETFAAIFNVGFVTLVKEGLNYEHV